MRSSWNAECPDLWKVQRIIRGFRVRPRRLSQRLKPPKADRARNLRFHNLRVHDSLWFGILLRISRFCVNLWTCLTLRFCFGYSDVASDFENLLWSPANLLQIRSAFTGLRKILSTISNSEAASQTYSRSKLSKLSELANWSNMSKSEAKTET